jgi:hypothetical protein
MSSGIMFNPDDTFGSSLDFFVANYYHPEGEDHRKELLSLQGDEHLAPQLEAIAELLLGGATDLAAGEVATFGEAIQSLIAMGDSPGKIATRLPFVMTTLDLWLADDVVSLARTAEKRFEALLSLARRTTISKATAAFLKRVSRCYLYGFDVECAIMCRSAMDAEFQSEISADDCIAKLGRRPTRDGEPLLDLSDRIAVAGSTGRLDKELVDLAHKLRKETNSLVHRNPRPPADISAILEGTLRVISALQSSSK